MIVELFGLPGSGKTFMVERLRAKGSDLNKNKSHVIIPNLVVFLKKIAVFFPSALLIRLKIKKILKEELIDYPYIDRPLKMWINNIVMVWFGYEHLGGRRQILLDEGLVQRIVAMCVNCDITYSSMDKLVNLLVEKEIHPFYLKEEVDNCMDSIRTRNRHVSEMDELEGETLHKYLIDYANRFDHISNFFGFHSITRSSYTILEDIIND